MNGLLFHFDYRKPCYVSGNTSYIAPNIMMGTAALLSALACILLVPETLGVPVPDTAGEARDNKRWIFYIAMPARKLSIASCGCDTSIYYKDAPHATTYFDRQPSLGNGTRVFLYQHNNSQEHDVWSSEIV